MALPPLLSIRDILRLYGVTALRNLGQNFLLDPTVHRKLTSFCPDLQRRLVIEIGPGPGGLTRALLERGVSRLVAIERDRRFQPALAMLQEAAAGRLAVVFGDALEVDAAAAAEATFGPLSEADVTTPPLVTGNLPFSIAGPLIARWMRQVGGAAGQFPIAPGGGGRLEVMVQREVADRIVAPPGTAQYGRLSVVCQHRCHARIEYPVPRRCFVPQPDVDGAWVSLQPHAESAVKAPARDVERFATLAFRHNRKTCRRALLAAGVPAGVVADLLRAEQLTGEERFEHLPLEMICRMAELYRQIVPSDTDQATAHSRPRKPRNAPESPVTTP